VGRVQASRPTLPFQIVSRCVQSRGLIFPTRPSGEMDPCFRQTPAVSLAEPVPVPCFLEARVPYAQSVSQGPKARAAASGDVAV
jgi:hypothetical protein